MKKTIYWVSYCSDRTANPSKRFDSLEDAQKHADKMIRDFVGNASGHDFDKAIRNHAYVMVERSEGDEVGDELECLSAHYFGYRYYVIFKDEYGGEVETLRVDGEFRCFGAGPGDKVFATWEEANRAKKEAEEAYPNASGDFKVEEERY